MYLFVASQSPVLVNASTVAMSSKKVVVVGVGSVARRPSVEIVEEMAEIARGEKARMVAQAAPTPTPTPCPGQYSRRRPIKHRKPLNPAPPPEPEFVRVAAIRATEDAEREAYLLEEGDRLIRRPRTPTPPRKTNDHYDLAKWTRQRRT